MNQLKFEVHDTYKKDEKISKNFEPIDDSDNKNKAYLDEKMKTIDAHISFLEKDFNDLKLQYYKQSVEDILIQGAVKTTIQIFSDKGLIENNANADKVLEDSFYIKT